MTNKQITLVRGDDSNFLNQVLLVVHFKTNLNLDNYKMRLTIENPTNIIKIFEVVNNAVEVQLDKVLSSTLSVGLHKCNIKLIDTLNCVKTVKNFEINIEDEFDTTYTYPNEYELEVVLDDGINKYKNYNELSFIPTINQIPLKGDKNFEELGVTQHIQDLCKEGIEKHNTDKESHRDIRDEIFNKQDRLIAGANITIQNGIISSLGAQGGVTTNYKDLGNKPSINSIILDDDKSLDELGIQPKGEYITEDILNSKGYLTTVPTGYITEEELESEGFLKEVPDIYYTDEQNQEIYFTKEEALNKQNKLTAGNNIKITEGNIINSVIPDNYITEEILNERKYTTNEELNILLNRKQNTLLAGDNIKLYKNIDGTYTISALSPKDQQNITSYNALSNLPQVNNIVLTGNKTLDELGIQPKGEYQDKLTAGENISIIKDENNNTIISTVFPDDLCTDSELYDGLSTKADKATTLEGYNIQDTYTKEEIDNNIKNSFKNKITDIILNAPNGVLSYTENAFTIKNGITVLFSNGLKDNFYKNIEVTLDKDLTINMNEIEYSDLFSKFYIALSYDNMTFGIKLLPESVFNIVNYEVIPQNQSGYIKNIADNKFYEMVYQGNNIALPKQMIVKILGICETINNNGKFKIKSVIPYTSYRLLNQDEFLQQVKNYQTKLRFGENFEVENNEVNYKIPYNYVTKEYLIANDFTTKADLFDYINIHNTNSTSHQDIRNEIKKYATVAYVDGKLQGYAEITDLPDARNYCTKEEYGALLSRVVYLENAIKQMKASE